jgi:hypothetical protein
MDKDEIGRALAKVLAENGYINIIEDDVTKKDILDRAKWYEEIRDGDVLVPIHLVEGLTFLQKDFPDGSNQKELHKTAVQKLKQNAKKIGANYLFTKTTTNLSYDDGWYRIVYQETVLATPYAIILPDMEEKLQKCYKGGAPKDVVEAAQEHFEFELEPDMVQMYRDSPDDFIVYLRNMDEEKVFQVLKEIAKLEKRNKEVDEWLLKKYHDLCKKAIRRVM